MRKLVIGMRNNQGFTLIEILVVLVIIGITLGFALIAFGDFGESKRILFAAEHMINNIRLAQQQAILGNCTLGIFINKNSYQILELRNNSQWKSISNTGIFRENYFPANTLVTLSTTTHPRKGYPAIIINASGNMTPFTLSFSISKKNKVGQIKGSSNGDLHFIQAGAK